MLEILNQLSKDDLKRIAIVGGGLNKFTTDKKNSITKILTKMGMVQLDPINPAGRNHDIYFFSRFLDYKHREFEKTMYKPFKGVFEVYFPNLMAVDNIKFGFFSHLFKKENLHPYYKEKLNKFNKRYPRAFNAILTHISKHGPTSSADLAHLGKSSKETKLWKSNRVSGTGLELLWLLGKLAVVSRDSQFKKAYDLIENYLDAKQIESITNISSPNTFEVEKLLLKLQYKTLISVGNVNMQSLNDIKIGKTKIIDISLLVSDSKNKFFLAIIPGTKKGVLLHKNWEFYLEQDFDDHLRPLCPLDPLIHDRELLNLLFDFDYTWEIYKKPEQRKWGYYVYPLLYQDQMIGRLEGAFKKNDETVKFFNFQPEKDFKDLKKFRQKFRNLLLNWSSMIKSEGYNFDSTLSWIS